MIDKRYWVHKKLQAIHVYTLSVHNLIVTIYSIPTKHPSQHPINAALTFQIWSLVSATSNSTKRRQSSTLSTSGLLEKRMGILCMFHDPFSHDYLVVAWQVQMPEQLGNMPEMSKQTKKSSVVCVKPQEVQVAQRDCPFGSMRIIFMDLLKQRSTSSWWFQPIWKILVKLDHLPR